MQFQLFWRNFPMARNSKNLTATIVTVIVALMAACAVFFLVWTAGNQSQQQQEINQEYVPTEEVADEMKQAATDLLKGNYEVFRLFYTKGISYQEEPYGNLPEDGFYTCADDTYKTYADMESFVKSVFVEAEAQRILTASRAAYQPKIDGPVYGDDGGKLGLSADFVDENGFVAIDYDYSWANPTFTIEPKSDIECGLVIVLKDSSGNDVVCSGLMLKVNGQWRLNELIK